MIHIHCNYFGSDGWARHAQGFVDRLRRHIDIGLVSWNTPADGPGLSPEVTRLLGSCKPWEADIGIGIGPIERMKEVTGRIRIAFVVWETTRMPRKKRDVLRDMDQIWTPSRWGRELLIANGLPADLVKVVPEGVDADLFKPAEIQRPRPTGPVRFLCIGKWERRKGVSDLITAYCREFSSDEKVELVLACHNPYIPGFDARDALRRLHTGSCPPIHLQQPADDEALVRLYQSADVFVLPSKAEGWGLPIIEAMACGLPVMVTDYSAYRDFVTPDCAYPIPVKKLTLAYDPIFFRGFRYGRWAQPDLAVLQSLLRHACEHPEELRQKGTAARRQVAGAWTWDQAARKAIATLVEAGWLDSRSVKSGGMQPTTGSPRS